jgi:hypothetical protein
LSRPNWSRALPRPIIIPKVMTLKTLADVRELMRHIPADRRERSMWRHVDAELGKVAAGADTADVAIALRMVGKLRAISTAGLSSGAVVRALPPTLYRLFTSVRQVSRWLANCERGKQWT